MSSAEVEEVLTHRKSSICIVSEIEIDIVTFMDEEWSEIRPSAGYGVLQ